MSFEFNKALNMTKENDRDINSNTLEFQRKLYDF